jgi:ATP-binding protein involved in chromosome partitioning
MTDASNSSLKSQSVDLNPSQTAIKTPVKKGLAENPYDQQRLIPGIKNIIAVGSGKGGVGKSSMTAHIAVALKQKGFKVGILDTDIYGPSIPRLFGCLNQKPAIDEKTDKIKTIDKYGIKLMSMGFLIDESQAVVWRGPMLFKALDQFFRDVEWGELDYLLIDLPPGTGDIALSVAQKVPVLGAFVVSTPQNLSLVDARKAFDMFEQIRIPVLGYIENMSYLKVAGTNGSPDQKIQLFPKGQSEVFLNGKSDLKKFEFAFEPEIGMACETGIPLNQLNAGHPVSDIFGDVADYISSL